MVANDCYLAERESTMMKIPGSEKLFLSLLEAVPDVLVVTDREGYIVLANSKTEQLFGYTQEELLGQKIEMLLPARLWESHQQQRADFLSHPHPRPTGHGIELVGQHRDGREIPVEIGLGFADTEDGSFILCYMVDATIRKQTGRKALEAERLRVELEKEQELRQQIVPMIVHEFRNPLSVILIAAKLLRMNRNNPTTELFARQLTMVEKQTHTLAKLLDGVLAVSRASAGRDVFQPAAVDLKSFCRMVWDQIQFADKNQHDFVFSSKGDLDNASADGAILQQILSNLFSNAVKYSPEGSGIQFKVRRKGEDAVFTVADQGIGIPEQAQSRIFDPFHRAENTAGVEGTGLGLAIVKNGVELHGGTIKCRSIEGKGTTFIVRLPLFKEQK